MGIYDRPYYRETATHSGWSSQSMVMNLVLINVVVFVVDAFLLGGSNAWYRPVRLFAVYPDTIAQPWTWWRFLTYGFCHDPNDIGHIFTNMLGLFFLGQPVEAHYGRQTFLRIYTTALMVCSVVWSLVHWKLFPAQVPMIGASGAVTTIVLLFAINFPRRMVMLMFIPMPAWVLGIIFIAYDLVHIHAADNVAYDVHLTGAAYAFAYFRTGFVLPDFTSLGWFDRFFRGRGRPQLRIQVPPEERFTQIDEQADAILDKLHREGQDSLTARERRILEEYSRRMKNKLR